MGRIITIALLLLLVTLWFSGRAGVLSSAALLCCAVCPACMANGLRWLDTFVYQPPPRATGQVAKAASLPLGSFGVTPAKAGRQLIRVSLPFAPGTFLADTGLNVRYEGKTLTPDVRVLTMHPGTPAFVRRAIVTFPFNVDTSKQHEFVLLADSSAKSQLSPERASGSTITASVAHTTVTLGSGRVKIRRGTQMVAADLIAPDIEDGQAVRSEIVEQGKHYLWLRLLAYDAKWPRIIEVRADSLGTVAVQAHVQRLDYGGGRDTADIHWQTAPNLGWGLNTPRLTPSVNAHAFAAGKPCTLQSADGSFTIDFPVAPHNLLGQFDVVSTDGRSQVTYHRATVADKLSHQPAAWRRAEFVIAPTSAAPLNSLLEPAHKFGLAPAAFDDIYGCGVDVNLSAWPKLADVRGYARRAILHAVASGDDFGNVTQFRHGQPASKFGLNRLNHCPVIFEESFRSGDRRLRDVAVNWCNNFCDLSLWWGLDESFGGTRYPWGAGRSPPVRQDDPRFTWRGSQGCNFCTKGYDSFLYAYEETGDPRMLAALRAQLTYAAKFVRADTGECRNIGAALDFMRLCRFTGDAGYLAQANRLWLELKTKLMPNNLFSQSGEPIEPDPPFINDDDFGYKHPFAKPYIIGYALLGLPYLLEAKPNEPRLAGVIAAVSAFLAKSQDPVGGWSYPHPSSGGVSSGMENAVHLTRAAAVLEERGGRIDEELDAIERTLRLYIHTYHRCGAFYSGITAWEIATGQAKTGNDLQSLYAKPTDRNRSRDYTQGGIVVGGVLFPEQFVYFTEVLNFYLKHRPAERLETVDEPLKTVLHRMNQHFLPLADSPEVSSATSP